MEWIDISVFISSTFNDMHAERDLLLKKVFPVLSEWCARRRIRLFDIDLRWGVTSEVSKSKNTVEVCLRNVDDCRPFFLCFLGQRRGYIPSEINPDTYVNYPGITDRMGKSSVTEMEIEHALLAPMLRLVNGRCETPAAARNSLFFVRDSAYLSALNESQRMIFTNADAGDEQATDAAHAAFVSRVRNEWDLVWDYTCRFDTSLYSAELKTRDEDAAKGRLTGFRVGNEPLDRFIVEAMKKQILAEYPDRAREITEDEPEPEADRQKRRAEDAWYGTVRREAFESALSAYCESPGHRPLCLYGKPGSGKTTLLARFFHEKAEAFPRRVLRFGGITPSSSRWEDLWSGILEELGLDAEGTEKDLSSALRRIAEGGCALIAIDGVDELDEGLSALASLPASLPDGLRLILTFRSDAPGADALLSNLNASGNAVLREVSPLSGDEEVTEIIDAYLKQYLKAFDDEQIEAICESPASRNPLFLKILLRELRVFGSRRQLVEQIAGYGETPRSAFAKLLDNLEKEISYNPVPAADFVPQLAGTLARVRGSVSPQALKKALRELLGADGEALSDTLAFYLRRLGPYLSMDGNRLGLSYSTLRESALVRYAALSAAQHSALARALKDDEPLECIYHHRMAGNREEVAARSEDIPFLCRAVRLSGAVPLLRELEACAADESFRVCAEVLDCLRQTAPLIGRDSRAAAALFYKELKTPSLRGAAAACCGPDWLRYEPVPMKIPESEDSSAFRTLFTVEHMSCQGFCFAGKKAFAFLLSGMSDITVFSLEDGTERASFSLPVAGRVRKIACSPDGALLAAAAEDLSLYVCRVALDDSLRLLTLSDVCTDQCASVRFGGVCLFASADGLVWQRPDGSPVRCAPSSAALSVSQPVSDRLVGCFPGGTVWKSGGAYLIRTDGGPDIPFPSKINEALPYEGQLFIAAENRLLTVLDPKTGETLGEYPLESESLNALAVSGGVLYGADRYGALVRLKNSRLEALGRITDGDNVVDAFTRLQPLPKGKIAFVSFQRRAVLLTESEKRPARLLRFFPQSVGTSFLWDLGRSFIAVLAGGTSITHPFPALLTAGRNLNEKNNLKAACSTGTLAFESPGEGLFLKNGVESLFEAQKGVPEMNGWLSDLCFVPETGTFRAVSYKAEYMEITQDGVFSVYLDLPRSESALYMLCPCGKRTAVLSRRVQARAGAAASAFFIDVLTMFEGNRVLWRQNIPRESDTVTGMAWDRGKDQLALFFSVSRMRLLSAETGSSAAEYTFPVVHFSFGAAVRNGLVFFVSGEGAQSGLTVRSPDGRTELSLPSQRRVQWIMESPAGVCVQEGGDKVYLVTPEINTLP